MSRKTKIKVVGRGGSKAKKTKVIDLKKVKKMGDVKKGGIMKKPTSGQKRLTKQY
jgi:hypothetical protein